MRETAQPAHTLLEGRRCSAPAVDLSVVACHDQQAGSQRVHAAGELARLVAAGQGPAHVRGRVTHVRTHAVRPPADVVRQG